MDRRTRAWWCAASLLVACGSGPGGAPVVSNLAWTPHAGPPGIPLEVTASVDVEDADADVTRLELSGTHSSGLRLNKLTHDVQNPPGATRSTVSFGVVFNAPEVGTYTVTVQAFDAKDHG